MARKRYAIVGASGRALGMFAKPLLTDFADRAELVGVYDSNPLRSQGFVELLEAPVPVFAGFQQMLSQARPDAVIVACRDCHHAEYVIAALRAGKRAISEKPLCTTAAQVRQILAAAAESPGLCLVTHNARYGAETQTVRSVLRSGRLGTVRYIEFHEMLDRCHGADYFRRWHRVKANSGGLLLHKASHHFDQLNYWAQSRPVRVWAQGALVFYGRNGRFRSKRCLGCPHAKKCPFYADFFKYPVYDKLYRQAEKADGYFRDGCVWANETDAEDQMQVHISYESGLQVSYTLTAYSPYESVKLAVEGSKGRLEYEAVHGTGWIEGQRLPGLETVGKERMTVYTPGKGVEAVPVQRIQGGHGGADPQLRQDFFGRPWNAARNDKMASVEEAAQAILIGHAANVSMATGKPVDVQRLLARG